MGDVTVFPFDWLTESAGNKKWVSAAAAADYGTSQALLARPGRPTLTRFDVGSCRLLNRSGLPCMVGLGARYQASAWMGGGIGATNVFGGPLTEFLQTPTGFVPFYDHTLPDGNGLLIGAQAPFNTLSFIQTTAGDQTTPVLALSYWNGTAWTDMAASTLYKDSLITALGEKLIVFLLPSDWVVGGAGTNIPQTTYNLKVTHTVAAQGVTDPRFQQMFIGYSHCELEPLGNNVAATFADGPPGKFPAVADALFPIFSVASVANMVDVKVRCL